MVYRSFTEMPVWQKANKLAVEVYKLTIDLPRSEDYGLTSQIRRSSNGVGACISEVITVISTLTSTSTLTFVVWI